MKIDNNIYQFRLLILLFKEAGLDKSFLLILLNCLSTILELFSVTIIFSSLFDNSNIFLPDILNKNFEFSLLLFIFAITIRSIIISFIEIKNESLNFLFERELRLKFLEKILYCKYTNLNQIQRGELLSCSLNEINKIIVAYEQGIRLFQSLLSILLFLILLNFYSKEGIIVILIAAICTVLASSLKPAKSWELGTFKSKISTNLHALIGDGLIGLKTIKAYNSENWFLYKLKKQYSDLKFVVYQFIKRNAIFKLIKDVLIIIFISLWLLLNKGKFDSNQIALQLYILFRLSNLIGNTIQCKRTYELFITSFEKFRNVVKTIDFKSTTKNLSLIKKFDLIEKFCWFSNYKCKENGYSLTISSPSILAISGPSGKGKTNFLDRLVGIVEPFNSEWDFETANNHLRFSGEDQLSEVRPFLSYCPQDVILFEGSLIENLLMNSYEEIPKEKKEIEELISYWFERLNLNYLLKRYKNFDELMGLSIAKLSCGEMKRLGLIRSFLLDRQIEVYDEPTSSLDNENIDNVNQILLERSKSKFIIVATHESKLLKYAKNIIRI